jgi:hypothetical protein
MWNLLVNFIEAHPIAFWSLTAVVVFILMSIYGKLEDLRDEWWLKKHHNHNSI